MKKLFNATNFTNYIRGLNHERLERRQAKKLRTHGQRKKRKTYAVAMATVRSACAAPNPLVSIVVVGFNGAHHLSALVESLQRQTYRHFELIYVDNASHDDSVRVMRELMPDARIIESAVNTGFAEGNNLGIDHAEGDFILLLNNDARMDDDALAQMVATICADETIGAVAPKIRFWEKFVELKPAKANPSLDLTVTITESSTGYRKVIKRSQSHHRGLRFLLPASARKIEVHGAPRKQGEPTQPARLPHWQGRIGNRAFDCDAAIPTGQANWVINNAGSWVNANGDAGDWGFGEYDEGQYDEPCLVDAFCGCCALIRPAALGLKPLFPSSFFAYYEDTDASERITRAGFHIVYQPAAVVYHKHASTSVEDSPFFKFFTQRNHLAFQAAHFPYSYHLHAESRFENWQRAGNLTITSRELLGASPYASDRTLLDDSLTLAAQAQNGAIYQRPSARKRIGVFNEFWASMGGGELRALHIALDMRAHGDVYLISRTPIDIPQICAHFGLPSQGLKSAVIPDFQARDTASLDIFINTAFSSTLHSRARKSAYLVSFPHAEGHVSDMESYDVLLANSRFTQNWCNNYWPSANTQLLYPAAKVSPDGAALHLKERLIVSVGRFFPSGHSKRQLEMVQAFRQLVSLGNSNWRLVLIGGCNLAKGIDDTYLAQVKELARDLPIDILVNAPADIVEQRLQQASIYWHATGVGLNGYAPIEFEHFGMAIVEAMSHSAVPIIHNRGGMPEIVEHGVCGYHFDSLDALISQTQALMRLHDQQPDAFRQLASAAHTRSQAFSLQVHSDTLRQLVTQYLV